jgi:hypothetical protein
MTEEETKPIQAPGEMPQPDEQSADRQTSKGKPGKSKANMVKTQQTQEESIMANLEETGSASTPTPSPNPSPLPPPTPTTPAAAIAEYTTLRATLIGPLPEWCLPRINAKAKASSPTFDDSAIIRSCPSGGGIE